MSSGHIRRRGAHSWELKFALGRDSITGRRKTHISSFRGSKREASAELTRLMASATGGDYVNPTKITVAEFFGRWLVDWAGTNTTAKTAEGYALTVKSYITPHLGALLLQRLDPITLNTLYGTLLREGGRNGHKLSARSVSNVHRLIHAALAHAVKWRLIVRNPADDVHPPRVESRQTISVFQRTKREDCRNDGLTASAIIGGYVDSSKITVTEFLGRWLRDWAGSNVTPKTVEGYTLIARSYVDLHLGAMQLQKLKPITLTEFYADLLREGGHNGRKLSPRSVGNVHRLLHAAMAHAVKWELITANPADSASAPRSRA